VLLNKTIVRHGNEVKTKSLQEVRVETDDVKIIDQNMTKCSEWLRGHDKAKTISINLPAPKEVLHDIDSLNSFVAAIRGRKAAVRAEREAALKPKLSPQG
jgi:hypothetical protein